MREAYILDNGEQYTLDLAQMARLITTKAIYYCPDCDCYHLSDGWDWDAVEQALT